MNIFNVNKQFQFSGFNPDRTLKRKTQRFYDFVVSRSPSDSKKLASLIKNGTFYEARLKISSASPCSFDISSKTDKVSDSMKCLEKQFVNKILNWNKKRNPQTLLFK